MSDDFKALSSANALITARTPEGLKDMTYRLVYLEALKEHGVKIVDALVVMNRILLKDAASSNGVTVDAILQHYGIQFKSLQTVDTE